MLRFADLEQDLMLLDWARELAPRMLEQHPQLAQRHVGRWLGGKADVVMSDMAAAASGHKGTDHLRIIALVEAALAFAFDVLEEGGTFVAKVLAELRNSI